MKNYSFYILILGLCSCATAEFNAVKDKCTVDAIEKMPPEYQQKKFVENVSKKVPTGGFNCVTISDTGPNENKKVIQKQKASMTNCNPVYEDKLVEEEVIRTVDSKQEIRDSYIETCTRTTCREKYGNEDCKTKN